MNSDGKEKHQVTSDGSLGAPYQNINWKQSEEISYSKCDAGKCNVYTYDLSSSAQELFLDTTSDGIDAIGWSPDGKTIVYEYVKINGKREVILYNGIGKIIKTWDVAPGRGTGFDDGLEIEYSQDGSYFYLLYTFGGVGESPITIFDEDGDEINTIDEATFPGFYGKNLYYKNWDTGIYQSEPISGGNEEDIFSSFFYYNPQISSDGKSIITWSFKDNGDVFAYIGDIENGVISEITDNFSKPIWIDSSTILGIPTEPITGGMIPFNELGLAKIGIDGKGYSVLTGDFVSEFAVGE